MERRRIMLAVALFAGFLFVIHGCSEKKVYTLDEPGAKTASLSFPEFIQIRGIDGESVESLLSRMIYEGQNEVVFPAGPHEIELRYNDIWDIDDNDHEKITSRYVLLQFDAKAGGQYKFNIEPPDDRRSAQALAARFNPAIIDVQTGKAVSRFIAEE